MATWTPVTVPLLPVVKFTAVPVPVSRNVSPS